MEHYYLHKAVWTQKDYQQMGWHDSTIYGWIFKPTENGFSSDIVFDMDYIFQWVDPVAPKRNFSFWVAPCSLVFKNTFSLTINIDRRGGTTDMLEVADLYLVDKVEEEVNKWMYEWTIDLQEGRINFKSTGFDQVVRQQPVFTDAQCLTLEQRKGISFDLTPCM